MMTLCSTITPELIRHLKNTIGDIDVRVQKQPFGCELQGGRLNLQDSLCSSRCAKPMPLEEQNPLHSVKKALANI